MLSTAEQQDLAGAYYAAEENLCALARTDMRAFFDFVMRDEET